MNGIYLVCSAGRKGSSPEQKFTALLKRSAGTHPTRLERAAGDGFCGAVMHHGRLRSAGAATAPGGEALLVVGGSWLPEATGLCSPSEILQTLASARLPECPLLRGSYLLALYCPSEQSLVVENDPFGFYPLYYGLDREGDLHITSELKCLASVAGSELDLDGLAETLHFGSIISDRTLLTGILRLPPNHRLCYRRGKLQVSPLPRPRFTRCREPDGLFFEQLRNAFERYLGRFSDQPELAVLLSGGLDSRLALAAARRVGLPVRAITVGEPGSLESRIAGRFARSLGISCESHVIDGSRLPDWFEQGVRLTEGRCPPGHMHYLDRMLTGTPVRSPILHGINGDAFMGGDLEFDTPPNLSLTQAAERATQILRSYVYWPSGRQRQLFTPALLSRLQEVRGQVADHLFHRLDFAGGYSDLLWFRVNYRVFGFIVPCLMGQILPWSDPVVPYSDPEVFALLAEVSHAAIRDRQLQIRWGQAYYPEIAAVPRVKDGVLIPLAGVDPRTYEQGYRRLMRADAVRYYLCRLSAGRINLRRTKTYPYYDQWFRRWKSVREFAEKILLSEESLDRGLWRREGLRSLLADLRLGRDVWHALAGILMTEILLRELQRTAQQREMDNETLGIDRHTGFQRSGLSAGHAGFHPFSAPAGD